MIAPMKRIYIAARQRDRKRLLETLRGSAVVHLEPVEPARARADEETTTAWQRLARTEQILSTVNPAGEPPGIEAAEAAEEVLQIFNRRGEYHNRLNVLRREAERLAPWGDVRLEQLRQLEGAGVHVEFASLPAGQVEAVEAEWAQAVGTGLPRQVLVMAASRKGHPVSWPEGATPWELPPRDRPTVLAEAARLDAVLREDAHRLAELAHLAGDISEARMEAEDRVRWLEADGGALGGEELYALQGWIPASEVAGLEESLVAAGLETARRTWDPDLADDPPTRLEYHPVTRPMKGLFDILGTVPGYREFDVSGAFLIALPVFAAMLIADGGYGLLLLLPALVGYRRLKEKMGAPLSQLIILIASVTVLWGLLISSFFGLSGADLTGAGGFLAPVGAAMDRLNVIGGVYTEDEVIYTIIRFSFLLGAIHLSFAHLWRARGLWPSFRAVSHVGWAVFLWGMLIVVNALVLGGPTPEVMVWLLGIGGGLAILFAAPSRNLAEMLGKGLASFPLAAMSTLSDTISYIRLMAVGLASSILAVTFNDLAGQAAAGGGTWAAGAIILIFGHLLNIGLGLIALFAHGVRLNMLEFSNNLGMTWSGYPFEPFAAKRAQAEERD